MQQEVCVHVCSDHFISGKPSALYASTNPDWVPTLKLGYYKAPNSLSSTNRYHQERRSKRCRELQEVMEEDEAECDNCVSNNDDDDDDSPVVVDKAVQTDYRSLDMLILKESCKGQLSYESLKAKMP